jgi:hypothetical protein
MKISVEKSMEYSSQFPKSVCSCKHSGDGANSFHGDNALILGHGACVVIGCECQKFSWSSWSEGFKLFISKPKVSSLFKRAR